jgi:uncharacterized protein (TIGR03437 family)
MLAALAGRLASGASPAYSSDSILNGADFAPGPFAPNSFVTIFGTDLSYYTASLPQGTTMTALPYELANVRVYVNNYSAPLIYVCPTQINLLVPGNLKPGAALLYVVRQGVRGPDAMVTLAPAAPQLFATADGRVIAQHADYSLITADSPAIGGETIIVYAAGLGPTQPNPAPGEIPQYPAQAAGTLTVSLDGSPLPQELIKYAGVTPGSAGVYQINLLLPASVGANPEIRVGMAGQSSREGVVLPAQPSADQAR